jgi:uncharacterized protein YjdB
VTEDIPSATPQVFGQHNAVIALKTSSYITNPTPTLYYNNSVLTYENKSTLGISIQYPSNWKRIEVDNKALIFLAPSKKDAFSEKLTVAVFNINSSISTNQLFSGSINNYGERFKDFFIIDSRPITFGGMPGYLLSYTYNAPNAGTIAAMDIGFKDYDDDKAYVISYSAQQPEYNTFSVAVEKMVESFRVISA